MELLPWYIAGPLLGLTVPVLLVLRGKQLGVSSSFRVIGARLFPRWSYFRYDSETDEWQLLFVFGIVLASVVFFPFSGEAGDFASTEISASVYTISNAWIFFAGAILLGFGARYAGGCTAGHCVMGASLLAPASLISTVCFFIGGLAASYFIVPQIFTL